MHNRSMHMGKEEVIEDVKIVLATVKQCHELHLWCYIYVLPKHNKVLVLLGKESYANLNITVIGSTLYNYWKEAYIILVYYSQHYFFCFWFCQTQL